MTLNLKSIYFGGKTEGSVDVIIFLGLLQEWKERMNLRFEVFRVFEDDSQGVIIDVVYTWG